ncbi:MAG: helix-turn-helix transcriptional regulator [Sphingomonadales bacterium]|nr:helix-turn-helix transcriptional regulator [Sphingomonadales bacterium]
MTMQLIEIDGKQLAVLPLQEYRRLVDAAEDQDDLAAAVAAEKRRDAGEEFLPSAMVNRLIDGENALRVWREHRNFSLTALAEAAGINKASLSLLENGKSFGRPATWRALADVLRVTVDEILPLD